ncbi:hypothetical protein PR001_g13107 [Phytophthora rubi]|uniref:WLGC domain-containing protein n=1 Tax=Phytophthora rubi TaxID=129364 RepID=A0A6A3LTQ4_9STRA|nr:hypothetical protein PR001_g13107 [Phytophthora rubi]
MIVVIICIVWTSWLVFLTMAPNEAANLLMNTGDYDNGNFWLINDRAPLVKWTSAIGLAVVDACYVGVVLKLVMFRRAARQNGNDNSRGWNTRLRDAFKCSPKFDRVQKLYADLTGYNAKYRKFFNLCHKVSDLVVQSLVLRRILNQGLPTEMTMGYASFVCVNALSASMNILTARNSAFVEVLIDSCFDLIAAVVYPIAVLGYCYKNFNFDRAAYLVNAEVLPDGNFERLARTQADPAEVALFLINFDSLRISGAMDFALSVGLNLSFCYRFFRVVNLELAQNAKLHMKRRRTSSNGLSIKAVRPWQRPVPRWVALPFVAFSALIVTFTYTAVSKSQAACADYPECVAFSHIWNTNNQCPCIMLIDGDRAPRTAQEWNSPRDVTKEVRALAAAGLLQQLQLINRQLMYWPEELRRCTGLRTISLIYTSTAGFPNWAKEFKQLELLHVEGKYGSQNLVTLPSDLFEDMPHLKFLHLGNHHNLVAIPPFDGTPNLRSITFAILLSLTELPSFDKVPELETLLLIHISRVVAVPDLAPLTKLSRFTVFRPNHLCCNGFIGSCNLQDSFCQYDPVFNIPAATCLEPHSPLVATTATQRVFQLFQVVVCQKSVAPFAIEALSDMPSPSRIASCAGVPYRQCEIPGVTSINGTEGMCYSSRMQVIACNVDPLFIKVRRVEIERGVGPPCDPQEEAWLGCK